MSRILEQIVADMKPALEAAKRNVPFPEMKKRAENARAPKNFVQAFQDRSRTNVIAELKKASPSKGLIRRDFRYMELAHELENAGAAAFSVLTERNYFLGSLNYLLGIVGMVNMDMERAFFYSVVLVGVGNVLWMLLTAPSLGILAGAWGMLLSEVLLLLLCCFFLCRKVRLRA